MVNIVLLIVGLIVGAAAGYIIANQLQKKKTVSTGNKIIREAKQAAENIKKEKKLEAKGTLS